MSLGRRLAKLRFVAGLRQNRQYLVLLLLDLVFFSAWSVITGIAPAGDIRAHIFRTLEFAPGLSAGDYTSIQYHGYAFLAGYGVGFYAITWTIYSFLATFVAEFQAATIACNVMWLLTPLVLALSAVALAGELGIKRSRHRRLMETLLGANVLLLPGGALSLTGADPFMLSFSFSLLALAYGLRTREEPHALLGLVAFSALSIYTESFGYFFVGTVFLGLIAARRRVLKVLPVLAAISAFSWVQLTEVAGYTSPYIEYVSLFGVNFLTLFGVFALLVCTYFLFVFTIRGTLEEGHRAVLAVLAVTLVATASAVARGSFGLDFGVLNGIVDNILPWRLVIDLSVLLLVSVYAICAGNVRFPSMSKVLAAATVVLILSPVALGMYPVAFDPLPPAENYGQYGGLRLLVAGPALTSPASPVAYSPAFGYSTVSGAFSQGDPSFFSLTVYYEWSQYLVSNRVVADNLMHLTGADELITGPDGVPSTPGTSPGADSVPYSQAAAVTPILLEAPNDTEALEFALFVNLLGRNGFMLDFVTSASVAQVYGVVVLPGYQGSVPSGLPVYPIGNASRLEGDLSLPLVRPFVTPPFDLFGPVSNSSVEAASSVAASLIAFFHPVYASVEFGEGASYYSVSSNSSLPIQIDVSYYPYFSPANYSQNVYHFILLPGPETIVWHLPLYEEAAAVSLVASIGVALLGWAPVRRRLGKYDLSLMARPGLVPKWGLLLSSICNAGSIPTGIITNTLLEVGLIEGSSPTVDGHE